MLLLEVLCFVFINAQSNWGNYWVNNQTSRSSGLTANLGWIAGPDQSPYDPPISNLLLNVTYIDQYTLRLKLTAPSSASRWEVPGIVQTSTSTTGPLSYGVTLPDGSFACRVQRVGTNEIIFDSNYLYYSNRYLQWGTALNVNSNVYGLGERVWSLRYDTIASDTFSFINSDLGGTPEKLPLYGSHPFFLNLVNGSAYGVFLLNSNVMDVVLGSSKLIYKTTGGILDVFIFTGPSPQSVLFQYHKIIGRPYMPPLWGLGYHQCRWGYSNYTALQSVIDQMNTAQFPVDTYWVDIDYMDGWRVWTTDPVLWPTQQFGNLVRNLHASGHHFVPIVDPGVKLDFDGYDVLLDGIDRDVFVKSPESDDFMVGKVWPGRVYFPDWTHPNVTDYWMDWTATFSTDIPIDGVWIDMNEASSFCDGRCLEGPEEDNTTAADGSLFSCNCSASMRLNTTYYDEPPYFPVDAYNRPPRALSPPSFHGLDIGTISFAAQHYLSIDYNLHNLYGHFESIVSSSIMATLRDKRPFVITRSTFPGTGAYVGHWLGDNESQWSSMRASIAGAINFGLFGIPLVGADICGFSGNTTSELCQRWMQLGAFYPFSRNHNTQGAMSQEPYAFGSDVLASNKAVFLTRYSLLPYFYTLFYQSHIMGGPVMRALFYQFPSDPATYANERQFMIGPSLLISPVLDEGITSMSVYFPPALWYNYFNGSKTIDSATTNRTVSLSTPMNYIPVHVLGGSVVPTQEPNLTTVAQKRQPYQLLIALTPPKTGTEPCECSSFSINPNLLSPCNACLLGGNCASCCGQLSSLVTYPCTPVWIENEGAPFYGIFAYAMPICNLHFTSQCATTTMATGSLFFDDGDSLNTIEDGLFLLHSYVVKQSTTKDGLYFENYLLSNGSSAASGVIINQITIYGQELSGCTGQLRVNLMDSDDNPYTEGEPVEGNVNPPVNINGSIVTIIDGLSLSLLHDFQLDINCRSPSSTAGLSNGDLTAIIVVVILVVMALVYWIFITVRRKRQMDESLYMAPQGEEAQTEYHAVEES